MIVPDKLLPAEAAVQTSEAAHWTNIFRSRALICLALAIATLAVFSPVMWNDFVNYDDPDYVTANPHVQSGLKWANVAWAFKTGHASNWHPLTWVSHMVDCQLFGQRAGGHHLMGALLHAANVLLLFLLLNRM